MQSLGHLTQGFFFAMATLRPPNISPPLGVGSLLLSLSLHLAVLALLWQVGWHPTPTASAIMEVRLLPPEAGLDSGPGDKPSAKGQTSSKTTTSAPALRVSGMQKPPGLTARKKPLEPGAPSRPQEQAEFVTATSSVPAFMASGMPSASPVGSPAAKAAPEAGPGTSFGGGSTWGSGTGGGSGKAGEGQGSLGGGAGALAAVQSRYLGLIRARILAHRHYPPLARARHLEGEVRLRFTLNKSGRLSREVEIVKPSGFAVLDEQATECIRAAAPFPPFPPELQKDSLTVEVPIVYRLKDWSG